MQPRLIKASTDPFAHFVLSDFYESEFAEVLTNWLSTPAMWRRAVHHFYDQFEFNFKDVPSIPETVTHALLTSPALSKVRLLAENLFETQFRPNVCISAHKLVDGQGIGIHTDSKRGAESHRILVQLSKDWQDDFGGQLVFFGSDNIEDVKLVFRHAFNTAIGFSLGGVSYHAVSNVMHGERLTVIYGFWSISSEFDEFTDAQRTFMIE